jgi:plasmid stability protein
MASLTIRNLPDDVRERLAARAAASGRSLEEEARAVLAEARTPEPVDGVPSVPERVARLQAAFAPYRSAAGSVVDELVAERKIEAWTEILEDARDMNEGSAGPLPPR